MWRKKQIAILMAHREMKLQEQEREENSHLIQQLKQRVSDLEQDVRLLTGIIRDMELSKHA